MKQTKIYFRRKYVHLVVGKANYGSLRRVANYMGVAGGGARNPLN